MQTVRVITHHQDETFANTEVETRPRIACILIGHFTTKEFHIETNKAVSSVRNSINRNITFINVRADVNKYFSKTTVNILCQLPAFGLLLASCSGILYTIFITFAKTFC